MKRSRILILLTIIPFQLLAGDRNAANSANGIWQSIGYGRILKIDSGNYSCFDITKISCLPARQGNLADFDNTIKVVNDTLLLKKGFTTYYFRRLNKLPKLCEQKHRDPKDALYNFEVFAQTFKEHYAYFKLNGVNWDSLYSTSKNKINTTTSGVELYIIIKEMLDVLRDNHGSIEPPDEIIKAADKAKKEIAANNQPKEYGDFEIADLVAEHFLTENLTRNSEFVKWGKINDNIGFIQVKAMMLFADLDMPDSLVKKDGYVPTYFDFYERLSETKQFELEVKGISSIMDKVMKDLRSTQYIILDVRFNGGGIDEVGLEILRRFNPERKRIAWKKARHNNGYTNNIEIILEASEEPYTKPVYILTSRQSASATDMIVLSSLELKHTKRIGSHTQGALSDALQKQLPNGWHFSLSNEIYTDNRGIIYESIGIPVDYELKYPSDRQTFFRNVANNPGLDRKNILNAIEDLKGK